MAHQCIRCNIFYEDGSEVLLKGCPCGAKLFFYVKNPKQLKAAESASISKSEAKRIEEDLKEIMGVSEIDKPVVLDLENVQMEGQGKYNIDLVKIFKGDPLVYKVEEGKYMIDVAGSFQMMKKKKE
jgi:uncharacterized protein